MDGQLRLVEGLAIPREEAEFRLSYYSSNTTWVHLDRTLAVFGLTRDDLTGPGVQSAPGASPPPCATWPPGCRRTLPSRT